MNPFCVGISHHTANVDTRERYALRRPEESLLAESGCAETLMLATCNRVEVYAAASEAVTTEQIAHCLARGGAQPRENGAGFYRYEGEECVRHLFRVVCGLDSMVIGETEILGQVKKAYAFARESGSAGPLLHRLFQRAFRVAKQVRSRTEITRGAVSVGSVVVDLAVKIFRDLAERKVLLLGAGEMSERAARALSARGVSDIRVSNRSFERAERLAASVRGRAVAFQRWPNECREIDILISSTAAQEPLLTAKILEPMIRERLDRPLFIIDIAVPRDVAPEVNKMDGVFLYDIDALQSIAEQSLALRRRQIAPADAIIAEHVADFRAWYGGPSLQLASAAQKKLRYIHRRGSRRGEPPDLVVHNANGEVYTVRYDALNAMFTQRVSQRASQGAGIGSYSCPAA
jgi:glutamyl-tRNA reductase